MILSVRPAARQVAGPVVAMSQTLQRTRSVRMTKMIMPMMRLLLPKRVSRRCLQDCQKYKKHDAVTRDASNGSTKVKSSAAAENNDTCDNNTSKYEEKKSEASNSSGLLLPHHPKAAAESAIARS